jgi:transposase
LTCSPTERRETVSAWLLKHPSIKVVSRDGSSEYASAIQKGAPQAQQVSDRWHLVKNLAACVSVQLTQSLTQLRRAEQAEVNTLDEQQPSPERQSHPRTRGSETRATRSSSGANGSLRADDGTPTARDEKPGDCGSHGHGTTNRSAVA